MKVWEDLATKYSNITSVWLPRLPYEHYAAVLAARFADPESHEQQGSVVVDLRSSLN